MKKILLFLLVSSLFYAELFDYKRLTKELLEDKNKKTTALKDDTIKSGLKEALNFGADYAIKTLGKKDGFLNSAVKIPLPQEFSGMEKVAKRLGQEKLTQDLVVSMNTAASQASAKTRKIFAKAIKKMDIDDAKKILFGGDAALSDYFKKTSYAELEQEIKPVVKSTVGKNNVAKYYEKLNSFYKGKIKNSSYLEGFKKLGLDTQKLDGAQDINDYVCKKTIDGLFAVISEKEKEIRKNPAGQTKSIVKKVFGELTKN
ncbi:MAG: DUF4197 domain-containing protein [Helicobacteraceae bacterium]